MAKLVIGAHADDDSEIVELIPGYPLQTGRTQQIRIFQIAPLRGFFLSKIDLVKAEDWLLCGELDGSLIFRMIPAPGIKPATTLIFIDAIQTR